MKKTPGAKNANGILYVAPLHTVQFFRLFYVPINLRIIKKRNIHSRARFTIILGIDTFYEY